MSLKQAASIKVRRDCPTGQFKLYRILHFRRITFLRRFFYVQSVFGIRFPPRMHLKKTIIHFSVPSPPPPSVRHKCSNAVRLSHATRVTREWVWTIFKDPLEIPVDESALRLKQIARERLSARLSVEPRCERLARVRSFLTRGFCTIKVQELPVYMSHVLLSTRESSAGKWTGYRNTIAEYPRQRRLQLQRTFPYAF